MSLPEELERRNVVRVGVAYCLIGWSPAGIAESLGVEPREPRKIPHRCKT